MNTACNRHVAFTLIELMLAIALAMVICYSAFACVRMCSQCTAIVNRLSIENQLMRVGVAKALDELDFWSSYDDPKYGSRPLTQPNQPFDPLFTMPTGSLDFDQSKPRNWWRGVSTDASIPEWGNYGLVANLSHSDPDHRRCAEFLRTMIDKFGYYALLDYAPANTMYSYYNDSNGIVPDELCVSASTDGHMYGHGWGCSPRAVRHMGEGTAFTLTNNTAYHAMADITRHNFVWWANFSYAPEYNIQQMYQLCGEDIKPLPQRPQHWPALDLTIRHFYAKTQVHSGTVTIASPITGQAFKLYVTTTSTTLRGARRQRGLIDGQ